MRQTRTTVLARTVIKAHVLMVLRRHFVSVQLGRWGLPVTKVRPSASGCRLFRIIILICLQQLLTDIIPGSYIVIHLQQFLTDINLDIFIEVSYFIVQQ